MVPRPLSPGRVLACSAGAADQGELGRGGPRVARPRVDQGCSASRGASHRGRRAPRTRARLRPERQDDELHRRHRQGGGRWLPPVHRPVRNPRRPAPPDAGAPARAARRPPPGALAPTHHRRVRLPPDRQRRCLSVRALGAEGALRRQEERPPAARTSSAGYSGQGPTCSPHARSSSSTTRRIRRASTRPGPRTPPPPSTGSSATCSRGCRGRATSGTPPHPLPTCSSTRRTSATCTPGTSSSICPAPGSTSDPRRCSAASRSSSTRAGRTRTTGTTSSARCPTASSVTSSRRARPSAGSSGPPSPRASGTRCATSG